jgi:hypothetical protein
MGAQHSNDNKKPQRHNSVCGTLNIDIVKRENHLLREELAKVKCELEKTKQDLEISKCQVAAFINISHD